MTEKKSSVFTKGQLHGILRDTAEKLKEFKSVKEAREYVASLATQYRPQAKGRGVSIDVNKLQAIVDETVASGNQMSAKSLACLVCAKWNLQSENTSRLIEPLRVKNLVLKGKLKFPTGVEFVVNPRKPRGETAEVSQDQLNAQQERFV